MAKKKVIGKPRKHEKPGNVAFRHLENIMAGKQYNPKVDLVKKMAKKGYAIDIGRLLTKIRRDGGIAVNTPFGYTSTPHIIEIIHELARRKSVIISNLVNANGILAYIRGNLNVLKRGGTPEHEEICRNILCWFEEVTKYSTTKESRRGLRHLRR